jgi:ParB family chromosome partitioning protein
MVSRGTITPGAGRALLAVRSANDRFRLAREVADGNLTVRQLEALGTPKPTAATARSPRQVDANLAEVADELQSALAMRVRISGTPRRGAITIAYHSPGELARLHKLLTAEDPGVDERVSQTESESLSV